MASQALMYDAADPAGIPPGAAVVAGYIDGAKSAWPAPAWSRFAGATLLHISVLADPAAEAFDCEAGNATAEAVAAACSLRLGRGLWSMVYCAKSSVPAVAAALRAKSILPAPASSWPAPAVYLWVADLSTAAHLEVPGMPVQPAAVQYRWAGAYDVSVLWPGVLSDAPGQTPPPTPADPLPAGVGAASTDTREDQAMDIIVRDTSTGAATLWLLGKRVGIPDGPTLTALQAAGIPRADVSHEGYDALVAALP